MALTEDNLDFQPQEIELNMTQKHILTLMLGTLNFTQEMQQMHKFLFVNLVLKRHNLEEYFIHPLALFIFFMPFYGPMMVQLDKNEIIFLVVVNSLKLKS